MCIEKSRTLVMKLKLLLVVLLVTLFLPLHAKKELRVGIYQNPPKIFLNDDGIPSGFFIDLLNEIASKRQWSLTYVPCVWDECLSMLQKAELDIMPDVAHTKKREQLFLLGDEPVISSWSVLYRHKDSYIDSILNLDRKHVGVLRASIQSNAIKEKLSHFNITPIYKEVDSFDEAFKLLSMHKLDAVLVNRFYHPDVDKAVRTNILLEPSMLKFAFNKNTYDLKKETDQALKELKQDHTSLFYTASHRWLEEDKQFQVPTWVGWMVAIGALTIVLLFALVLLFRYHVKKKSAQLIRTSEELQYLAQHDELTELPNRFLFMDRLSQVIVHAKRQRQSFAVLLMNIDHFTEINEGLGHTAGDKTLRHISDTLKSTLRDDDTIARFGGDEFILILEFIHDDKNYSRIMAKLQRAFDEPLMLDDKPIYLSFSSGVALYPENGNNVQSLLSAAEIAMKKAKKEGRNNFQFFSETATKKAYNNLAMVARIRENIEQDGFTLHYQPKICAQTGTLIGSEVLIRWFDKELGTVPPIEFIPIAEEHGLIISIGDFVLESAIKQYAKWYEAGYNPGRLAVNVSLLQFKKKTFTSKLIHTLTANNLDPEKLEIEITESQLMINPEHSIKMLNELHSHGISVAIDDFGTGYSSLSYLKLFPVSVLKIDKSFVTDIPEDQNDCEITQTIIAMANSLKLKTVAEGVETVAQKTFLGENGCDIFQGYLFDKPLPADIFERKLQL